VAAARNLETLGRERNLTGAENALHVLESEFTILQQELHVIQSAPEPATRRKPRSRSRSDARFQR
jgi:hypothetical protein